MSARRDGGAIKGPNTGTDSSTSRERPSRRGRVAIPLWILLFDLVRVLFAGSVRSSQNLTETWKRLQETDIAVT